MVSVKQYREKGRERQKRWLEKQKEEGRKRIVAHIKEECLSILEAKKKEGKNTTEVIEEALIIAYGNKKESVKKNVIHNGKNKSDKKEMLKIICRLKKQGLNSREIAEDLNKKDYPTVSGRGKWSDRAVRKWWGACD